MEQVFADRFFDCLAVTPKTPSWRHQEVEKKGRRDNKEVESHRTAE